MRNYSMKYRDPRWQKKRLAILQRDQFTCQKCGDSKSTLEVHHRLYESGKDPWEYEDNLLITLCRDCHESEKEAMSDAIGTLIFAAKSRFLSDGVLDTAAAIGCMPMRHAPEVIASAMRYMFARPEYIDALVVTYQSHKAKRLLAKKRKQGSDTKRERK